MKVFALVDDRKTTTNNNIGFLQQPLKIATVLDLAAVRQHRTSKSSIIYIYNMDTVMLIFMIIRQHSSAVYVGMVVAVAYRNTMDNRP